MTKKYIVNDRYTKEAKKHGYRARSVYKLREIDQKFDLIKKGDKVLDLGAAPGSFLQYIAEKVGKSGFAVGIDLKPIKPLNKSNVITFEMDIFDETLKEKIREKSKIESVDVLTSDIAPSTTGIKHLDAGRSADLTNCVLTHSKDLIRPGGNMLIKIFPGGQQKELIKRTKKLFNKVTLFQPDAVRKSSSELYIIGLKKIA